VVTNLDGGPLHEGPGLIAAADAAVLATIAGIVQRLR
jgi:hypothetical protein